jgi:hypothetical protein
MGLRDQVKEHLKILETKRDQQARIADALAMRNSKQIQASSEHKVVELLKEESQLISQVRNLVSTGEWSMQADTRLKKISHSVVFWKNVLKKISTQIIEGSFVMLFRLKKTTENLKAKINDPNEANANKRKEKIEKTIKSLIGSRGLVKKVDKQMGTYQVEVEGLPKPMNIAADELLLIDIDPQLQAEIEMAPQEEGSSLVEPRFDFTKLNKSCPSNFNLQSLEDPQINRCCPSETRQNNYRLMSPNGPKGVQPAEYGLCMQSQKMNGILGKR